MEQVAQIPELNKQWLAQGLSAKEELKRLEIRHEARLTAREMMADPEEVEDLKQRDIAEYGNEEGPTFEFLVNEWREAGLKGNALYLSLSSKERVAPTEA